MKWDLFIKSIPAEEAGSMFTVFILLETIGPIIKDKSNESRLYLKVGIEILEMERFPNTPSSIFMLHHFHAWT